jgi:hypothetical protein
LQRALKEYPKSVAKDYLNQTTEIVKWLKQHPNLTDREAISGSARKDGDSSNVICYGSQAAGTAREGVILISS